MIGLMMIGLINSIQNNGEHYARLIANQNAVIKKLEKELIDRKHLTKDIIDQARKTINENNKERLEYYDKYKNTSLDYIKALEQLNNAENTYGREIANLNNTINDERIKTNELRNKIQNLEDAEKESLETINELNDKLDELENKKYISESDKKILQEKIDDLIDNNNKLENFIEVYNDTLQEEKDKMYNDMKDKMHNFDKNLRARKINCTLN